jgi:hypothetical protein
MQTAGAFGAALVALTALLVLLLLLTAVRKALRAASERRREHLESLVRPALLQYLAAEDPDPARLDVTGRGAGHSLDTLAAGLLPKLRGEDRDALARVLTDRGALAAAPAARAPSGAPAQPSCWAPPATPRRCPTCAASSSTRTPTFAPPPPVRSASSATPTPSPPCSRSSTGRAPCPPVW